MTKDDFIVVIALYTEITTFLLWFLYMYLASTGLRSGN
jgi:hypothetical protein